MVKDDDELRGLLVLLREHGVAEAEFGDRGELRKVRFSSDIPAPVVIPGQPFAGQEPPEEEDERDLLDLPDVPRRPPNWVPT